MSFVKFFTFNKFKKQCIYKKILKNNDLINKDNIKELLVNVYKNKDNDIFEIIQKVNLTKIINNIKIEDKYYPCPFIDGHIAWISCDNKGHYRFFSMSKNKVTYSLDFLDLYGIMNNIYSRKIIKKIINDFNLSSDLDKLVKKENIKINRNIYSFENLINSNKNIKDFLGESLFIYKILCKENLRNIVSSKFQMENNTVFFSSTEFIKDNYNIDMSISTINRYINLLSILNLITKVKKEDLQEELFCNLNFKQKQKRKQINHISFYMINDIDSEDRLNEIKNKIEIFILNDLKRYEINRNIVSEFFSEEFANKIYVQNKSGKYINKKEKDERLLEKEAIDFIFKTEIIDNGYSSKEKLRERVCSISNKAFNELWKDIINNYKDKINVREVRPNNRMKKFLNLKTSEPVAIVRNIYA